MAERVVYLLGAGFSAPLGLPVTANFLEKSKDLYFGDRDRYKHFAPVLEAIGKMSVVKNYYQTELHNIEEILSILEMKEGLRGKKLKKAFLRYISDVVTAFTPAIEPDQTGWPANWYQGLFKSAGRSRNYGYFVASLLGARIRADDQSSPRIVERHDSDVPTYGVVTLNYDHVLERFAEYLRESFGGSSAPAFSSDTESLDYSTPLAKLHGSAESEIIIPPTWNKSVSRKILPKWQMAFDLLSGANHIRVIGYSLPVGDSYVKYLLRAAAMEARHLKRIDVICLDDEEASVRKRYSEFVDFPNFRFLNRPIEGYLAEVYKRTSAPARPKVEHLDFDQLELAHETFFTSIS